MSHNLAFGNEGEDIACDYLKKKGYRIRERQWRGKTGEIDIIAEKNGVFIFVEVKRRSSVAFGYPEEAVTAAKKLRLTRTTELYMQMFGQRAFYRIDIIAINSAGTVPDIVHFENITGT